MINVALLRPPRVLESFSMARYGDRLRQHAAAGDVSVADVIVPVGRASSALVTAYPRLGRLLFREASWLAAARRIAGRVAADVIHITDHSYASSVRYFQGKPTVVTCHDIIPVETGMLKNKLEARLYRANLCTLRESWRVIADSQATMQGLVRHGLAERQAVTVIPLGVDGLFFAEPDAGEKQRTRARFGLHNRGTLLIHVSNMAPYKNVQGVVWTFARFRREHDPDARLALVGPADRRVWRMIRAAGIEGAVLMVPPVPDHDLLSLYQAADVLLFPSLFEGFGLPVLEAMASGLPVVASNRGSLPELVADGVRCFDPDDYQGMCAEVHRMTDDEAYRKNMIAGGIQKARSFTWERCGAASAAVYRDLVTGGIAR